MARSPLVGTALTVARLLPAYLTFALLKRVVGIERLARWAWIGGRDTADRHEARRIIACVVRLEGLFGRADRTCLHRSLVLYRELSRLGADPTLWLGFRRGSQTVAGHAWVEVRGEPVVERREDVAGFERAVAYGRGGVREPSSPSAATS